MIVKAFVYIPLQKEQKQANISHGASILFLLVLRRCVHVRNRIELLKLYAEIAQLNYINFC